ncbi:hypothetical protein [Niabella hibiscisoli]|uniref:hypothetical protein n=1 Tax=Niabella hibiscisoli TaxID=1825928 RepID=UPI001F1041BA|nr:hypothetical protein [Niabella hibiscisoli]MCH5721091.1 hypothetical protein [Niabella hibiscisoli]
MKKGYVIILLLSGIIMPFVFLNAQNCLRDVTDGLPRASFFASGENGGEEYERAFNNDNNAGNKWYRGGLNTSLATPNWIGVNFGVGGGTAKILTGYLVSSANDFVGRNPRDWQFQGSNDGTNWLTLHTISNHSFSYSGQSRIFTFSNTTAYLQYRLLITETETTSESAVQIGEIELYENVCLEGFVRDAASTPLSGVTVAILGETYSIAGGGGSVFATATTDVTGKYRFDAASIPNGQFSLIVQPPAGYQVQQNAGPFFRDPTWANANQRFSLSQYLYTYDGSITFQNHLQLFQSGGTTGSVFWDNNEHSATYLNRFLPGFDKSSLNFILKQAQVTQVCATLLGSPGSSSNLITIADNGTFGSFDATSYLRVHPGQPGFSKDFNNTLLYTNGGLVNPTNTQYTYVNKANVGLGQGVLFDESRYTVSSFIGTIADLVDGTNAGTDATSLVNTRFTGWRKTFGTTTGDVYDKFLMVNGAGNNLPFLLRSV